MSSFPNCDKIARILRLLEAELGTPEMEVSNDPLGELVGTILAQNTTDTNSHRAYECLQERFPMWREVRDAPLDDVMEAIRIGGLAESKARTIQGVLRELPTDSDDEPTLEDIWNYDDDAAIRWLSHFKGVGVKTASCVLLFGMGRDVFPVDTHVHRVSNRVGLVATSSPDETHVMMTPAIPDGKAYALHVLLIRFGRRVCKARNPNCSACVLFDECAYEERHELAAKQTEQAILSSKENRRR
jgi:endonuclease-3